MEMPARVAVRCPCVRAHDARDRAPGPLSLQERVVNYFYFASYISNNSPYLFHGFPEDLTNHHVWKRTLLCLWLFLL
ncbi:protein of unknown function [Rhodovastum atsumiense]|nr:protein of unknown function [Rhodovastum atsumiense]